MADSFSIDVEGLNTLAVELEVHTGTALFKGSEVVRGSAQRVVATAQQLVPVDTGATKGSIHASGPNGAPFTLRSVEAEIGPTTEYAPHLEYGTVDMAPHAFMGPALDRESPDFVAALEQIPGLLL